MNNVFLKAFLLSLNFVSLRKFHLVYTVFALLENFDTNRVTHKSFNYKRVQVKLFTLIVTEMDNTKNNGHDSQETLSCCCYVYVTFRCHIFQIALCSNALRQVLKVHVTHAADCSTGMITVLDDIIRQSGTVVVV